MGIGRATTTSGGEKPKKKGPVETFSVNKETYDFINDQAEREKADGRKPFFQSLLEQLNENKKDVPPYGFLFEKQMAAVEKQAKEDEKYANRPQMKDESGVFGPINNKAKRDGKLLCFVTGDPKKGTKSCPYFAKIRVGSIGVCPDHVETAHELNEEYEAKKAAKA